MVRPIDDPQSNIQPWTDLAASEVSLHRAVLLLATLAALGRGILLPLLWPATPTVPVLIQLLLVGGCIVTLAGSYTSSWLREHVHGATLMVVAGLQLSHLAYAAELSFGHGSVVSGLLITSICSLVFRRTEEIVFYGGLGALAIVWFQRGVTDPVVPTVIAVGLLWTILISVGGVSVWRSRLSEALTRSRADLAYRVAERTAALQTEVTERRVAEREARRANVAKSTFLANMSHELRTPLNAITGYTELVGEDLEDMGLKGQHDDLEEVRKASALLLEIIDSLLDLARIEAGRVEIQCASVDLLALVEDAAAVVRPLAAARGTDVRVHVPDDVRNVVADPLRLKQVLVNLMGNAAKFTDNGAIEVGVSRSADRVRIQVRDTGCGIPTDALPSLFNKFTQLEHGPAHKKKGTGLGLAISRELTELMGGRIDVASVVGQGSTFTVTL